MSRVEAWCDLQIVIPVYDDWDSVQALLPHISAELQRAGVNADVLLVDDGSLECPVEPWQQADANLRSLRILKLRRNLGHQRAICVALCQLYEKSRCTRVLVMDGDGEDDPADIPRLLNELDRNANAHIVFAERLRRTEGWLFRFFYVIYRALHLVLVGHRIRVGNFSVMNRACLQALCSSPDTWNHYAASVFATRQPMALVPTSRANRLAGRSKMNFSSLVMHGLSALSVFADRISTRMLILSGIAVTVTLLGMVSVVSIRLATGYAIAGWATTAFGVLAILLIQILTFMLTFSFLTLSTRALNPIIPIRDCHVFFQDIKEVGCVNDG